MNLQRAEALARRRRISRRDFVQLAMATGLTAVAAQRMFAGAARAEPMKGGVLKLGISHGATTDTLDPGLYPDQFSGVALWGTLSNSLTEIDAKGNVVPDLAESFEPAHGAKKWVFKLRNGVSFHNGKEVTSADVVASIGHHLGRDSKSAAKALLAPLTAVKADGPATVIFELAAGNADFPYIASDYHLPIMPAKDDGTADWQSGVRTGPYALEKFDAGVGASFARYPNYFKSGKAWFDAVECLSVADVTARADALATGDIHYIDRADPKTLDMLKGNPEIVVSEVTGYGHHVYAMNVTVPPFDNPDVRNAVKYSLNRQDIVEKVFLGHGTPGNDNPIAPSVKFAADPKPRHRYDPDMVKSLLRKAGMEGLKIDLSVSDAAFSGAVDSALLWQVHAKTAGLDLNVIKEPADGYWANVWMRKPFVASHWAGRPSCDWMFTTAYAAEAEWNDTFWKNPRFNELLVTARAEADAAKRAAMYAEMQQLLHSDGGLVNLMFDTYLDAHSAKLAHGDVAANWPFDGMKIAERWWFAG